MTPIHRLSRWSRSLVPGLLFTAALAAVSHAGGIQMSAERAEKPFPRKATAAVLFVNTFECGRAHDFKLEARAEGVVNGRRSSHPLAVTPAGREGRFAIERAWPLEGEWVILITTEAWNHTANLVVRLEPNGGFVPSGGAKDGSGFIEITDSETIHGELDARAVEALVAGKPAGERSEVRRPSLGEWLASSLGL
ncbi:MAG TPA: hypothetical protein VF720_00320 [Candidatus Eisenbacteria bacterium]